MKPVKKTALALVFGSVMVASCATPPPEMRLDSDVYVIGNQSLSPYWIGKAEFYKRLTPDVVPPKGTSGHVKVQYLIDSNGNIFNPKILESEPEGVFDRMVLMGLLKQKYEPAPTNPERRPVLVEVDFDILP